MSSESVHTVQCTMYVLEVKTDALDDCKVLEVSRLNKGPYFKQGKSM